MKTVVFYLRRKFSEKISCIVFGRRKFVEWVWCYYVYYSKHKFISGFQQQYHDLRKYGRFIERTRTN